MIRHPNASDQAAVEAALRSDNPAAQTEWEFWVGPRNLDARVEALSYGREGDSIAAALETELSGALNPKTKGENVTVDIVVAGIPTRRFTGEAHKPTNSGSSSKLLANTAGWWAGGESSVKLGRLRSFTGYSPKRAAEEMLLGLPYRGDVDIEETAQQTFKRGAFEAFLRTDETKDVLDAVTAETMVIFKDHRLNGVRGAVPRPAPLAGDVVWTFVVGRDCDLEAFSYSPETNEYRDVLAYREVDGTVEDMAYAEIPGSTAPENATYLIPIETEGPEAYAEARQKVNEATTNLIHGESEWSLDLPWIHVLLEEDDVVEVLEPTEDETDLILRRWLCRVDLIRDDAFEKTQNLSGLGTYREERVEKTEILVPVGSGAVLHPLFGLNYLGWPYFSDSLSWVSLDPDGIHLILNVERAEADGVYLYVDPTDSGTVVVSSQPQPVAPPPTTIMAGSNQTVGSVGTTLVGSA